MVKLWSVACKDKKTEFSIKEKTQVDSTASHLLVRAFYLTIIKVV